MKKLLTAICIVIACTACQKEYAPDVRITNAPDTLNLLKRFAIVDISLTAPADTISIYTYTYDNLNRCSRAEYLDKAGNETLITEYSFNGTDSLISSTHSYIQNNPIHGYEYFTYDANRKMIKDSVIEKDVNTGSLSFNFSYNYVYTGNRIDGMIYDGPDLFLRTIHVQQFDNAENLLSEKDSSFEYIGTPPVENFDSELLHTNSYDSRNNPFYKIYPKYSLIMMYENAETDNIPFYYSFISKNNITSQSRTDNSPTPQGIYIYNDRFVYTYNSNNYPEVVVYQDIQNNKVYKGFYFY